MPEPRTGTPDLEAGLAEIDRRLREIQDELVGARLVALDRASGRAGPLATVLQRARSRPPSADPAELAPEVEDLRRQVDALSELRDRLMASVRELLDGYEAAVAGLTISAGPFSSVEAVQSFERKLSELQDVAEVSLRAYEGENRAIFDVHLLGSPSDPPSS
jgi:hypothetical protein